MVPITEDNFFETYSVHKLRKSESIQSFDCGDEDLNDFILNESLMYRQALLAVSYVVENKLENNKVAAYFSLAMTRCQLQILKTRQSLIVSVNIVLLMKNG